MQRLRLGLLAIAVALVAPAAADWSNDSAFASEQERRAYTRRLRDCELKYFRRIEDRTNSERRAKEAVDILRGMAERTNTPVC